MKKGKLSRRWVSRPVFSSLAPCTVAEAVEGPKHPDPDHDNCGKGSGQTQC
jgi:hypothetical protein